MRSRLRERRSSSKEFDGEDVRAGLFGRGARGWVPRAKLRREESRLSRASGEDVEDSLVLL